MNVSVSNVVDAELARVYPPNARMQFNVPKVFVATQALGVKKRQHTSGKSHRGIWRPQLDVCQALMKVIGVDSSNIVPRHTSSAAVTSSLTEES